MSRISTEFASPSALARASREGAKDATGVIRSRIGDTSMSHWTRKRPIDLTLKGKVISDHEFEVAPARNAAGPSKVLNQGRKAYGVGDRRLTGKVSKKTGKPLARRAYKRAVHGHGGKHTWDDGRKLIEQRTAKRLHDDFVKVLRREFGG